MWIHLFHFQEGLYSYASQELSSWGATCDMCRQLLVWEGWGLGSGQSLAQSTFGAGHQTFKSLGGKGLERKKSRTAAFFVGEFSLFLTHTNHPCCKLRVFPISAPEIGLYLFGRTLFVGMKSDLASTRRELFQRPNMGSSAPLTEWGSLSPTAAAGTASLLHLLFGPWAVLRITAFISNSLCFDFS